MNARPVRAVGLVAAAALLALIAPALAGADTVTEWNGNTATALATQDGRVINLHYAMVNGAMYDAVNAIDQGHEPYLISTRLATPFDSKEAAAATAAYRVLLNIVPGQAATLLGQYTASLSGIPDGTSKTRGIAVGEAAAAAMIAARTADGRFGTFTFTIGSTPGAWKPTFPGFVNDPGAWLKDVKPFVLESSSQFATRGPDKLTSRQYTKEFQEVKSLGSVGSAARTPDQTNAALYWAENPPRTWARIVRTLSAQHGLTLVENARLYAAVYFAMADSFIAVWDDKARWSFWRPITAIREADTDGNPATVKDDTWTALIPSPPYPEHPSGHNGISGATLETLRDYFGSDRITLTDTNVGGITRSWTRFSQMMQEIIDARVWSGIHFRKADVVAAQMGEDIAQYREKHYLQPVRGDHGHDDDD